MLLTNPGRGGAEILYEKRGDLFRSLLEGKILEEFAGQVFSKEESKRFSAFCKRTKGLRKVNLQRKIFPGKESRRGHHGFNGQLKTLVA